MRIQDYYKITPFYNFQKVGIIATKKDICKERDKYKFHQLKKFCKENDAIPFFLSAKNGKKEIYQFINLLCPAIIPYLVNRKKEMQLDYPYTKTVKNNFPKENYLDKAIIKKLQEDDSSYEGEKEIKTEKNKEEIIKEYLVKKEKEKNVVKKKKVNTIFNVGYKKKGINYDYKQRDFGDVIGQINLDLEKLFKKYRPDSSGSKEKKNVTKTNKKSYYDNGKEDSKVNGKDVSNKEDKKQNDILKDEEEWVNVNVDELVDEFMKSKEEFNKKKTKIKQKEKEQEQEENKESKKTEEKKTKKSRSEKNVSDNNKVKENEKEKITGNVSSKKTEENIKNNKEEEKNTIEKEVNNEEGKEQEKSENDEEKEEENEEKEGEKEEDGKEEEKEGEEKEGEEKEGEEKEGEEKEDEEEKSVDNKEKDEDDLSDENYENLSEDINEFQQSLMNEARRQQESN